MHQTTIVNRFLLFCAIFSHPARASPVIPRNSTQQWTFTEVCAYFVVCRIVLTNFSMLDSPVEGTQKLVPLLR
jgi:hypothetical protein